MSQLTKRRTVVKRKAAAPLAAKRSRFAGTLSQQAYQVIRDGILKGEFRLGAVFSRRSLAAKLGMSILPVSEALQKLESEGLVESRARVGTMVRIPTPLDIRGNYVVREALECQSARLFAEKASLEQRGVLQEMAAELDRRWAEIADREGDLRDSLLEIRKLHMRFHMQIAEASGYPVLCQAIEKNQVLVFATLYDALLGDQTEPAHWHGALMEALTGRDADAAEAAMRRHVREGLDMLLERLEPYLTWDRSKLPLEDRNSRKNGRRRGA